MKKPAIFICTICILLSSCGQEELNTEAKNTQLKELKSQLVELKSQIKTLENDLDVSSELPAKKKIPVRVKELKKHFGKCRNGRTHYADQRKRRTMGK
jgi:hypothetical protein